MTREIGTNYFSSFKAAVDYYADYGLRPVDVQGKVLSGEIGLGIPTITRPGDRLKVDRDGRYVIIPGDADVRV